MKQAIIKRLFIWANVTLTPLVGAGVLSVYHKLPPELQAMTDPWALTTVAVGLVAGALSWGLSKWQGIPVAEMQEWLRDKGVYAGRIDGELGSKTRVAVARAVDEPGISTEGLGDIVPVGRKPTTFKRPLGANHKNQSP